MGAYFGGAALLIASGSAASPGLPYKADLATGFYYNKKDVLTASARGVSSVYVDGSIFDLFPAPYANTGIGAYSLGNLTSGARNTCVGSEAGESITSGAHNTEIGYGAGSNISAGSWNVSVGAQAGIGNGSNNVAIGSRALLGNVNGSYNIVIGSFAGSSYFGSLALIIDGSDTGTLYPLIRGNFDSLGAFAGNIVFNAAYLTQFDGTFNATIISGGFCGSEVVNGKQGVVPLVAGVATIANTSITANSRIMLTAQEAGILTGFLRVSARVVGTSFSIKSSVLTDTATIAYEIFEPS